MSIGRRGHAALGLRRVARKVAFLACAIGAASAYGDAASAGGHPGIDYRHDRKEIAEDLHIDVFTAEVDIARGDVYVRATRPDDAASTTSAFAGAYECELAVNGDFYDPAYDPIGLAMGGGERWPGSADTESHGVVAAGGEGRVEIPHTSEVADPPEPWMEEVVGGNTLLVWAGEAVEHGECGSFCDRHPRTAAGVSEDGDTLILVAVDGRSERSAGATLDEMGGILADTGAHRALNLDGGGSTTFYLESEGGVVNNPADGLERTVANHLGVCVDDDRGDVTGYVREGDKGDESAGVEGAAIEASTGHETQTDAEGLYTLEALPAGEVAIEARAGELRGERMVHVEGGALVWASIAVDPEAHGSSEPDEGEDADGAGADGGTARGGGCRAATGGGDGLSLAAAAAALAILAGGRRVRIAVPIRVAFCQSPRMRRR